MKSISIVTGGSSGLGFSISKELVRNGYNVCIIGRDIDKVNSTKENLLRINPNVEVITFNFNISDETKVLDFYKQLFSEGFNIEYLFNVAGVGVFGEPSDTTKEKVNTVLEANLIGMILMTTNALKKMNETGGKIINIMSTAATKGNAKESIYCAAKWGAKGYTESLKAFYKGSNIKVVGVYPGGLSTPFWDSEYSLPVDKSKFMDPDEVAEQIVYAITKGNSMFVSDIIIDRK